jgi:hypothetical protein
MSVIFSADGVEFALTFRGADCSAAASRDRSALESQADQQRAHGGDLLSPIGNYLPWRSRLGSVVPFGERQRPEHALHIAIEFSPGGVPLLQLHNEFAEYSGRHPQDEQHYRGA